MSIRDMAAQLTLKAMELGHITMTSGSGSTEEIEKWNTFNAKQVSDFAIALANALNANDNLHN